MKLTRGKRAHLLALCDALYERHHPQSITWDLRMFYNVSGAAAEFAKAFGILADECAASCARILGDMGPIDVGGSFSALSAHHEARAQMLGAKP